MRRDGRAPVDVIVVGGGPAGATAARLLSSWGHVVTVLNRAAPRHTLGESLPPSSGKLFERVRVRDAIDAAGFIRSTGNKVWWGTDSARVERFGNGALGYQVSRRAFDRLLLQEAITAGAIVRHRSTVRQVTGPGAKHAHPRVSYVSGSATHHAEARWILDCSGRAGCLARHGWRQSEPGTRTVALVGVWERRLGWGLGGGGEGPDDETQTLVESYDGGWAWSVPVSRTRRYFTLMVDPRLTALGGRQRLAAVYQSELARAANLRRLAERGRLVSGPWARDASAYTAGRVCDDGLMLVGDASSFVDPLSSFGVKKAFASAWLAAVVTHTSLINPGLQPAALELYASRERLMYESLHHRFRELSREAAGDHETAFWADRADAEVRDDADEPSVEALRSDPDVVAAFAELKRRPSIWLRPTDVVRHGQRPTIRGNQVVLEEHLLVPAFHDGVRYLRSVDLVALVRLAPAHEQVPDLFEAYNRAAPPVSLPDFLGALSVLLGKQMLHFA